MSRELALKQTPSDLALRNTFIHQDNEVVASDIPSPKLLLMQGVSLLVRERKAQTGDIIRSTTGEKVADPDRPLQLVPLKMENAWTHYAVQPGGGQPQFRGQIYRGKLRDTTGRIVSSNVDLDPWETFPSPKGDGENWIRKKTLILYALLPSDVLAYNAEIAKAVETGETPDITKTLRPVVLNFQATSFKNAGQKVADLFDRVQENNRRMKGLRTFVPHQYLLSLICREEKKGANSWYVYDLSKNIVDLKDEKVREEADAMVAKISTGAIQVDDVGEDLEGPVVHTTGVNESDI